MQNILSSFWRRTLVYKDEIYCQESQSFEQGAKALHK